jgi:hypothetical protein
MEKIRIIGGFSNPGSITLFTTHHKAVAWVDGPNQVKVFRDRTSIALRCLPSLRKWYVPRVFGLCVALLVGLSRVFFMGTILGILIYYALCVFFQQDTPSHGLDYRIYAGWALAYLGYFYLFVAPWHGAEHKAAVSYNESGHTNMSRMKRRSRVTNYCGSRYVIPMILLIGFLFLLPVVWQICVMVLGVELILRVDEFKNWNEIPVIGHISRAFQFLFLTREPGKLHLFTARAALISLLKAREE